jgi:hypothetical protein
VLAIFAVYLGWLPVAGTGSTAHLVLPAITLGAALAAILAHMTRASLLEEERNREGRTRTDDEGHEDLEDRRCDHARPG